MCRKRREWALRAAVRVTKDTTNCYGESIDRKAVVGVETRVGHWLVSRRQAWRSCASEAAQDKGQREALGRPWTRFNNCTARLTDEPQRLLMRGVRPWPKAHDSLEIEPPEPRPTTATAPVEQINHIAGERTTFRMPECVQIAPAARPADDLGALFARMKAFAPQLQALRAAGQ
jgi:hypothetical protein